MFVYSGVPADVVFVERSDLRARFQFDSSVCVFMNDFPLEGGEIFPLIVDALFMFVYN